MQPSASEKPNTSSSVSQSSEGRNGDSNTGSQSSEKQPVFQPPVINLPKGGGAIQGIGEKFQANPVTGTGSMSVPIAMNPGRGGFTPQLALSYDSGAGNSPFGLGWNVGLPSIARKTSKGLPEYDGLPKYYDAFESDVFLLSGAEDLVPLLDDDGKPYLRTDGDYEIMRYIPRIEGLFARIEKWVNINDKSSYWKSVTKENITTIYGQSNDAKIVDPKDDWKVFQWKIEKSFDNKGNVIHYQYKKEDGAGLERKPIFEKNRNATNAYNQTYLKRVLYGNTKPYLPAKSDFDETIWGDTNNWLFELVLDYGEHSKQGNSVPVFEEKDTWDVREDIFSSFRSGFDIRTYRLCRQILMFHHFETELGIPNYLVKSTHWDFTEDTNLTQINSITHTGFQYDANTQAYSSKSFPPVSFRYTEQKIDPTIYEVNAEDLPNAPQGIDGQQYQFNDLYQEGLNSILSQKNGAWYYKRNEGNGSFGAQELVVQLPSLAANAQVQIADFGGNGLTDVIIQNGTVNGFYELSEEKEWSNFKPFNNPVNFSLDDPNSRMLDLDGNGIPDILLTENDCFVWYAADAKNGYKSARRVAKVLDEEQGPRVVFNESFQTIFLSDMTGDGLTDIVRIRNGEVCYWANMGYGNFSPKVTMANAPQFDNPDYFDPARLRLADIDGTGSIDLLYLGRNTIEYWLNHSGNSWGNTKTIQNFPHTSNLHAVSLLDWLGDGTACLVWSSPLPAEANTPIKYIRLMGETNVEGSKPYLLKETNNNMGAITRLKYEASTQFYLKDRKQGNPWITKLPFPVQVMTRQEIYDEIAGNHFVSRYAYHHGYFDRIEREFRGFGMVEQWDTEDYETLKENTLFEVTGTNWSEEIDIMPPIYTKTWFHNGYYKATEKISRQYEKEYYAEDNAAWHLSDTDLPTELTPFEKREAARALKGRALRIETYGLDGSAEEKHPFTVAETKFNIKTIQRKGQNRHASFYVFDCESLSYQYERNPNDPRIAHQTTLEIDDYGSVLKSAAIVYPRRANTSHAEQKQSYITYSEGDFINVDDNSNFYRLAVPFAQRTFEITGLGLSAPFSKTETQSAIATATEIPFESVATTGVQKRLVQSAKSSFYNEELTSELAFGEISSHASPYQSYEAVYTQGLINKFNKDGTSLCSASTLETEAGFIKDGAYWWRPSGKAIFDATHFYLPIKQFDPFGQVYEMGYDAYHLAMLNTQTSIYGKTIISAGQMDYRILQPNLITDPNGNQSQVTFDALGMVIATAIRGKNGEGDNLDNYTPIAIANADMRADMYANPHTYLQNASSFFYYDLNAWRRDAQPNYALSIIRETHVSEENGTLSKTQISFSYSDGLGQAIMMKVQAEPGDAFRVDNGSLINDFAATRWVGNGRTVFNNKGKPVKQYEPYFSHNFDYETEIEIVEYGVSPILHYDVLGRNVRTDLPDGTFTKVEFTAWEQSTYDQNDTVLQSDWYADRGSPDPTGNEPSVLNNPNNYGKRAAWLAAQHTNTPKVEYLDTLGRVFLMEDDNGVEGIYGTRFVLDILGNQTQVIDALDRLITINDFNLAAEPICTKSMDAGRRWNLSNIIGNPIYAWNDRDFQTRMVYDSLQRNTQTWISEKNAPEKMVYLMVYGEQYADTEESNSFGQIRDLYDQAGVMSITQYDFKGNPLLKFNRVCQDYKNTIDYQNAATLQDGGLILSLLSDIMEDMLFENVIVYDALNRPTKTYAPDTSETLYTYNEANFLEKIQTHLGGEAVLTNFVNNIDYDAKGQRTKIQYGNGITTSYEYDEQTFRLTRLRSTRNNGTEVLQDLQYHYDPVGNITDMRDDAQQTLFFQNSMVEPHSSYNYDALYRLKKAKGREHIGQNNTTGQTHKDFTASFPLPHANDGQAMRHYTRIYEHDALGNILKVKHNAGSNGWSRSYTYDQTSPLDPTQKNNWLSQTTLSNTNGNSVYTHDIYGNMTRMPHLPAMLWDYADQLKEVELAQGREYYTYTIGGGKDFGVRTRKVTEQNGKIKDRIYIGDFEVYRESTASTVDLDRNTLHIQDDKGRLALVDTLLFDSSNTATSTKTIRYQLSNHLGSATLEVDANADVISYEEYFAFGASSYRAGRSAAEVNLKRYRYVGKERDESTGLYEYGARYYASWFCRFVSVDDLKDKYPFYTPFQYAGNKPVSFIDLDGLEEKKPNSLITGINHISQSTPNGLINYGNPIKTGSYVLYGGTTETGEDYWLAAAVNTEEFKKSISGSENSDRDNLSPPYYQHRIDWIIGIESFGEFFQNPNYFLNKSHEIESRIQKENLIKSMFPDKGSMWNAYKSTWTTENVLMGLSIVGSSLRSGSRVLSKTKIKANNIDIVSAHNAKAIRTTLGDLPEMKYLKWINDVQKVKPATPLNMFTYGSQHLTSLSKSGKIGIAATFGSLSLIYYTNKLVPISEFGHDNQTKSIIGDNENSNTSFKLPSGVKINEDMQRAIKQESKKQYYFKQGN